MNKLLALCNFQESEYATISKKKNESINLESSAVFVESGDINVSLITADGKNVLLSRLTKDDAFGISNLFIADDLQTIISCSTDCTLIIVSKERLKDRILNNKALMEEYCCLCNRKLQFLIHRLEMLTSNSSRVRVAEYLLDNGSITPRTKQEIASITGISRAALYRELNALRDENIIAISEDRIAVIDQNRLIEIISES